MHDHPQRGVVAVGNVNGDDKKMEDPPDSEHASDAQDTHHHHHQQCKGGGGDEYSEGNCMPLSISQQRPPYIDDCHSLSVTTAEDQQRNAGGTKKSPSKSVNFSPKLKKHLFMSKKDSHTEGNEDISSSPFVQSSILLPTTTAAATCDTRDKTGSSRSTKGKGHDNNNDFLVSNTDGHVKLQVEGKDAEELGVRKTNSFLSIDTSMKHSDPRDAMTKKMIRSATVPNTPLFPIFSNVENALNPRQRSLEDDDRDSTVITRHRTTSRSQDLSFSTLSDFDFGKNPDNAFRRSNPASRMNYGTSLIMYKKNNFSVGSSLDMLEEDSASIEEVLVLDEDRFDSPRIQKRAKSLSAKDAKDATAWLKGMLENVKVQTDQDVKNFLSELEQLAKQHKSNSLFQQQIERIKSLSNNILECTIDQLTKGAYRRLMSKMQEDLAQTSQSTDATLKGSSKLIRKLMFIFSRCSRLLQFMSAKEVGGDKTPETRNKLNRIRSVTAMASPRSNHKHPSSKKSPLTRDSTPSSTPSMSTSTTSTPHTPTIPALDLSDTGDNGKKIVIPKLDTTSIQQPQDETLAHPAQHHDGQVSSPPLSKSPSKSFFSKVVGKMRSFTTQKQDVQSEPLHSPSQSPHGQDSSTHKQKKEKSPQNKELRTIKKKHRRNSKPGSPRNIDLLCRICEELVSMDGLEEHSKTCATRYNIDMKAITSDERLKRICKSIRKRIAENGKKRGNKSSRVLTDTEIKKLEHLATISGNVPNLPYTSEGIRECESSLEDVRTLLSLDDETSDTESMASGGDSSSEMTSSDVDTNIRRRVFKKPYIGMTVPIFGKRIDEVVVQKLTTMRERYDLITRSGQDPNTALTQKVTISDFEVLKPISRGAYGRVFLGRKKTTGDIYAIKVLKKEDMSRKNLTKRVLAERNIMAIAASNSFVVRFYYSFSGPEYLYLVMEYAPGGDLFSLLQQMGNFDEETTRHYIAEITLALEYLHGKGIVHRDLKPDNILIAADGHFRLTDFGLSEMGRIERDPFLDDYADFSLGSPSAITPPSATTPPLHLDDSVLIQQKGQVVAAGTPDYLAPEMLLGQGHSYTADWWAMGAIMFELLTGCPPFNDDTPQAIFDNILSLDIPWPPEGSLDEDTVDFIAKLLDPDPKKRLGSNGAEEVRKHPYLKDVDWNNILEQQPPFVPQVSQDDDTTYFQPREQIFAMEDESIGESNDVTGSQGIGVGGSGRSGGSGSDGGQTQKTESFGSDDIISSPSAMGASLEFSFLQHNHNLAEKNKQLLVQSLLDESDDTYEEDSGDELCESPINPIIGEDIIFPLNTAAAAAPIAGGK